MNTTFKLSEKKYPDRRPNRNRSNSSGFEKRNSVFAELDRAVKKARQERSGTTGYWNKKVIEAEENNPDR